MDKHGYSIELHPADPDEGSGFWVSIPELEGCFTQGDTYEQALARARDAIVCHEKALARANNKFRRIRDVRDL
jgi:predicted RNase H-like HicB family nuclease